MRPPLEAGGPLHIISVRVELDRFEDGAIIVVPLRAQIARNLVSSMRQRGFDFARDLDDEGVATVLESRIEVAMTSGAREARAVVRQVSKSYKIIHQGRSAWEATVRAEIRRAIKTVLPKLKERGRIVFESLKAQRVRATERRMVRPHPATMDAR